MLRACNPYLSHTIFFCPVLPPPFPLFPSSQAHFPKYTHNHTGKKPCVCVRVFFLGGGVDGEGRWGRGDGKGSSEACVNVGCKA
eukprot:364948-Chlamydomonas_euryale.AAC.13